MCEYEEMVEAVNKYGHLFRQRRNLYYCNECKDHVTKETSE